MSSGRSSRLGTRRVTAQMRSTRAWCDSSSPPPGWSASPTARSSEPGDLVDPRRPGRQRRCPTPRRGVAREGPAPHRGSRRAASWTACAVEEVATIDGVRHAEQSLRPDHLRCQRPLADTGLVRRSRLEHGPWRSGHAVDRGLPLDVVAGQPDRGASLSIGRFRRTTGTSIASSRSTTAPMRRSKSRIGVNVTVTSAPSLVGMTRRVGLSVAATSETTSQSTSRSTS